MGPSGYTAIDMASAKLQHEAGMAYHGAINGLQNFGRAWAADTANKQARQNAGTYRPGN